jgi:sulfide:quinone oxidoreductase
MVSWIGSVVRPGREVVRRGSMSRNARHAVVMTHRVLIAGSGVAAVEAVLALRHLAGRRCAIDPVAPAHAPEYRPASVAAPFGFGVLPPLDLGALARRYDVGLIEDALTSVDVEAQQGHLESGRDHGYDHLMVAVGAIPEPPLPGALTFRGPDDVSMVEWVMAEIARGHRRQLVVVVPPHATWSLPAYEFAIMAALEMRGVWDATVTVVTPEREPLWIFGGAAGTAMRELLSQREIALRTQARASHVTDKVLWLESGDAFIADTVISLPRLVGPRIEGLPSDDEGFLPTDAHGYVMGARGVLAAGDVTTFQVKQGGLATQQADAAAATIAHELGTRVEPQPFVPRLRGVLLTAALRSTCGRSSMRQGIHTAPARSRSIWPDRSRHGRCGGRPPRWRDGTWLRSWPPHGRRRSDSDRCSISSPSRRAPI